MGTTISNFGKLKCQLPFLTLAPHPHLRPGFILDKVFFPVLNLNLTMLFALANDAWSGMIMCWFQDLGLRGSACLHFPLHPCQLHENNRPRLSH